ncbi:hypothetical protein UlMin_007948 [Ulmus minor]
MSSSMLSGERRWASARRGGMTVLGKVVVPKPINLPSIRSENRGLDPKVEIVPKGTLSWGNKSSCPWGSSSLSQNTEGGSGSPSYLNGRPSSGNGTRPSTASSDRAYEHTSNVNGPNSRPASASGALTSNQTSLVSLRPQRPGSSHLARFAESSEHPVAWTASGTVSSDRAYEPTANVSGPNSRPASASGALTSNQTSLVSLRPQRPGSSHFSRLAESPDHPVAWTAAETGSSDRAYEPTANVSGPNSRPASASGALTSNQTPLVSLRPQRPGSSNFSRLAESSENPVAWTASSDSAYDPTAYVSGPNSRPASVSGALTSNQTSLVSLRPRSAETRLGNSHLSRIAEPSDHTVAWTAEKLGVTAPKNDGFSPTSGDFPTLGSGRDNLEKNFDSRDQSSHGHSGSSLGVGTVKEMIGTSVAGDVSGTTNVKDGNVNSWIRDGPPYSEDGSRPGLEKWQGNPQAYPVPPQHYDAWLGNPIPPGGFPMEPFPYYRPQIPAACIANPQPIPPLGAGPGPGPRRPHPKDGDMYRPHMPDPYIRPGMPIRPGFYPGPVAYEGYYRPPMGYCSSNERDVSFMGMAAGPPVYNRYPGQSAPEPGNSHGRPSGNGPTNPTLMVEQVESGYPQDTRGPDKVLLKQHDGWDRKNEERKSEDTVPVSASQFEKRDQARISSWDKEWRSDHRNFRERDPRKALDEEVSSRTSINQSAPGSVEVKCHTSVENMKALDAASQKKLDSKALGLSKVPESVPASPKDSTLIQKIEGLNAKARAPDGRNETISVSFEEVQQNKFQVNAKTSHFTNEAGSGSVYHERTHTKIINPASHHAAISVGDKSLESTVGTRTTISRGSTHGMPYRAEHHGRGRHNSQKSYMSESSELVSDIHLETSEVHVPDHHRSVEATEKLGPLPHGKTEEQSAPQMVDPNDSQEQRIKMREKRMKKLQEEEEERIRNQKAKALAKLEELNRRTQAVEGSTQKLENASSVVIQNKQEEPKTAGESSTVSRIYDLPKSALVSKPNAVAQINASGSGFEISFVSCSEIPPEAPKNASEKALVIHDQPVPSQHVVNTATAAHHNNPHVHESNVSKPKHTSFKPKLPPSTTGEPKTQMPVVEKVTASHVVADEVLPSSESSVPVNSNANADSHLHPRKKNNKNWKNKHKMEGILPVSALPPLGTKENLEHASLETGQSKASELQLDPSSVQLESLTISRDVDWSSEQHRALPNEDSHGRANHQWKHQQSRRMPRNPQANRPSEKFHGGDAVIWAPVRLQNKAEVTQEASPKNFVDAVSAPVKSDGQVQNYSKNNRAELERYVPKPVAKEMAQQGSNNQPVASVIKQTTTAGESIERAGNVSQGAEGSQHAGIVFGKIPALDSRNGNGNGRHNKQGKAHGSWRQRGSTESTSVQVLQEGSHLSNLGPNNDHNHPQKVDASSVKDEPRTYDEWSISDDWNTPSNSNSAEPVLVPAVKDQGITVKGKRHPYKGHKGMGNNRDLDQKKGYGGDSEKNYTQSSPPDMSQKDLPAASKENRGTGERSVSHWQPKSQALSGNNQRGNRPNVGQNFGFEAVLDKDANESLGQIHLDQSISRRHNAEVVSNFGNQEPKRERAAPFKGGPHSPNQASTNNPVEPAVPATSNARHEQHMPSGFRKNGNQNSRFSRGQDSRGDWNYSGQDNKQHNPPSNRESRPRHNSHYKYQPVGPHNYKSNSEGPKDGTENSGGRVSGRGQNHSRRGGGNFNGRQGGVRVDAGYN